MPGIIQDIIMLPLQPDNLIVKMYTSFDLPTDSATYEAGATVTMLGRRNEFPALSVSEHFLTYQAGPARYMIPEGQPGDSGGPVVSSGGLLVGMNIGSHSALPGQAMLISPEAIESVATAVNGDAKYWPRFEPDTLAQPRSELFKGNKEGGDAKA
ncbi:hypothetical protein [Pseudarthrobacter enclensis]|uniref:Peptidase S1 domain-containing protein n=1 Tax=Pseudarthrobacter enclensis TaxID=993070 RepID=A0ABT9S153_9MICC|nr:hypothetical protein [Pseudarthrobacter enclensis]MDP9890801.1 hypothetical protein [Pseudarthrobacter enclensis]